jgi:flagellar biosynthetic protein FlhB
MADDSSSEKKHLPSAKRIDDFRKQGQTMRSRDLASGMVFLAGVSSLIMMSAQLAIHFKHNFTWTYTHIGDLINQADFPGKFLGNIAIYNLLVLFPIFFATVVAALASPFIFGGWNFTLEAIQLKLDKLNPMNYFQKIFSVNIFMEVVRSMLKFVFIMTVLVYYALERKLAIKELTTVNPKAGIYAGLQIVEQFITVISFTVVFIIIFDILYHYYEFMKKAKMTTQEIKDEGKDTEGNPEIKRKIRSTQFAMMRQRLSVTVPQATVVITNPTHYAIALRYDDAKDGAPKILAKGKDHIAAQIRQLAAANGIPIYEAPPLARAIYHTGKIGGEIHPGLYMSVAIVLSYINQLRNYQRGIGQLPIPATDLKIPDDLIYTE